jgi:streptogramin lyase
MHKTLRHLALVSIAAIASGTLGACGNGGGAATTSTPPPPRATESSAPRSSPAPTVKLAKGILARIGARAPGILAATAGAMWVEGHSLSLGWFDPEQDDTVTYLNQVATHCDIAAGGGAVWAADAHRSVVTKVDPGTGAALGKIALQDACGVAADQADLWVASPGKGSVLRYDQKTLKQKASIKVGDDVFWVAIGTEGVWAAGEADHGTTWRIDPRRNKVVAAIATPNPFATGLEVGFGSAWVPARDAAVIYRIDPARNAVSETIKVPSPIGGIGVGSSAIWVSGWGDGMVYRIDPKTNQITGSLVTGYPNLFPPLEAFGSVWVSAYDQNVVLRLDPGAFTN